MELKALSIVRNSLHKAFDLFQPASNKQEVNK